MKVEECIQSLWAAKGLSQNTLCAYRSDIELLLKYLTPLSITLSMSPKIISEHISSHLAPYNSQSRVRKLASFSAYFSWLKEDNSIKENPILFLDRPRPSRNLKHVLSEAQLSKFLTAIDVATKTGVRDRAIFELLYGSGLRVSELVGATKDSINLVDGVMIVFGKGGKYRKLPLGEESIAWLQAFNASVDTKRKSKWLFFGRQGKPMTRQAIWIRLKHYLKKSGMDTGFSPHSLRHAYATHMLDHGADIRSLQMLLGHSSITTTQLYTHVAKEKLVHFHNKHHPRG